MQARPLRCFAHNGDHHNALSLYDAGVWFGDMDNEHLEVGLAPSWFSVRKSYALRTREGKEDDSEKGLITKCDSALDKDVMMECADCKLQGRPISQPLVRKHWNFRYEDMKRLVS